VKQTKGATETRPRGKRGFGPRGAACWSPGKKGQLFVGHKGVCLENTLWFGPGTVCTQKKKRGVRALGGEGKTEKGRQS